MVAMFGVQFGICNVVVPLALYVVIRPCIIFLCVVSETN